VSDPGPGIEQVALGEWEHETMLLPPIALVDAAVPDPAGEPPKTWSVFGDLRKEPGRGS
jgi:hypothetical protein